MMVTVDHNLLDNVECFFSATNTNPLCAKTCKRDGTIKTSFCASEFGKTFHTATIKKT